MNREFPDVQAVYGKGRGTRDQIAESVGSSKKQENYRKISASASLTTLKPLCGSQQTVENSLRDGNTRSPYLLPEISGAGQEAIELDMEQQTGSKLERST